MKISIQHGKNFDDAKGIRDRRTKKLHKFSLALFLGLTMSMVSSSHVGAENWVPMVKSAREVIFVDRDVSRLPDGLLQVWLLKQIKAVPTPYEEAETERVTIPLTPPDWDKDMTFIGKSGGSKLVSAKDSPSAHQGTGLTTLADSAEAMEEKGVTPTIADKATGEVAKDVVPAVTETKEIPEKGDTPKIDAIGLNDSEAAKDKAKEATKKLLAKPTKYIKFLLRAEKSTEDALIDEAHLYNAEGKEIRKITFQTPFRYVWYQHFFGEDKMSLVAVELPRSPKASKPTVTLEKNWEKVYTDMHGVISYVNKQTVKVTGDVAIFEAKDVTPWQEVYEGTYRLDRRTGELVIMKGDLYDAALDTVITCKEPFYIQIYPLDELTAPIYGLLFGESWVQAR